MYAIGKRIKQQRTKKGLTQSQIKELTGISSGTMSDIENGKVLPAALSLIKLSKVLECSTDWILTGVSPGTEYSTPSGLTEQELLNGFRELSEDDKEEIMSILQMKRRKMRKEKAEKSADPDNSHNMVG